MSTLRASTGREDETELRLIYAVGRFHTALRHALGVALKTYGLTVPQFTTLSVLSHRSGLSNAQLARRAFVTPQAMNQVLAALEQKGMVSRQLAPGTGPRSHHRARGATLTARGRAIVHRTDAVVDEIEDTAFADMSPEERLALSGRLLQATTRLRAGGDGER